MFKLSKHSEKRFKERVKNISLDEILNNCFLSHKIEKQKENGIAYLMDIYRYKEIALIVKNNTIITIINLQEEINRAIDFFTRNQNEHIIAIKDNNHNSYYLTTCIQNSDGNCGRYCNCDCTHWSRSFELELFSREEIKMLEEI